MAVLAAIEQSPGGGPGSCAETDQWHRRHEARQYQLDSLNVN